jgi:hypothetical protein
MGTLVEVDLRWKDCVKDDMRIKGVNMKTNFTREYFVPTLISGIRRR